MTPIEALMVPAWAMDSHAVRNVLATAEQALVTPQALAAYAPKRLAGAERATTRDGVAIVSAVGPMFKRAGWLTDLLGAASYDVLRRDLQAAMDNPAINSILLNVDSPGGEAAGVGELAAAVAGFRGQGKPIVAYAGDLAASAGYWLASAADSIVIGAGAAVGSIGVRATYSDSSARDAARGVKSIAFVSSQSPLKKVDLGTDEDRNRIQARIDAMAQIFVEAIAANRGVEVAKVLSDFGRGDVLIGKAAVAAGMADEIGTFEGTLANLARGNAPARRASALKSPVPALPRPVAPVSAPKALAPIPTPPPAPVVPPAVAKALAAERERVLAIRALTPAGVEAERDEAVRSGASVEEFRRSLGAFTILSAMRAAARH